MVKKKKILYGIGIFYIRSRIDMYLKNTLNTIYLDLITDKRWLTLKNNSRVKITGGEKF